jgi:transcription antitermination factor NusG
LPLLDATECEGLVENRSWYALYTRSHCEQLVYDQLAAKGFTTFLPEVDTWSRRGGVRHLIRRPLFPGYLFVQSVMDRARHVEVLKARGVVRLLADAWDRLAVVPDREIDAVKALLASSVPLFAHPYLREGQRVRIQGGPLADVEGILMRANASKGVFVVSLHLLQRSVAVEVDCTLVAPA